MNNAQLVNNSIDFECIIIGAGPGGLVTTKELVENGVTSILCLEQSDQLGGVFSKSYDNLQLTSSATFSMFSDFLNKEGEDNHFWSKEEAVDYWDRYAERFSIKKHIRFNSKVESVARYNGKWRVTLYTGASYLCRKLALATGNNGIEKYPLWAEELSDIQYIHSKNYKNASSFVGKRVLIVGGGESASDMALEISKVADASWISLRESAGWVVPRKRGEYATDISTHRGLWGAPRKYGTYFTKRSIEIERSKNQPVFNAIAMLNSKIPDHKGIWSTYGTKTIALAEAIAHHGCEVVGEVTEVKKGGRQLNTVGGVALHDVDVVVFSTGYKNHIGFMPEELQSCDPRSLYKHVFHRDTRETLAWIGVARPGFGSQFPLMEIQARLFALICAGKHQLPTSLEMEASIEKDYNDNIEQFKGNAKRIRSLVDYFRYMDGMAEIIGCKPPLKKYFFRHPKLWLKLMYGPAQATQYRLSGPGEKKALSHEIIKKLPVSTFNNVVKIGLKIRLMHARESVVNYLKRKVS